MLFVSFFHVVCKIPNIYVNRKAFGAASCTQLTLKKSSTGLKKKYNFFSKVSSPSHWAAGSEPNFAESQPTQESSSQSGTKRKKPGDFEDFALRGVSTPDTPYGAFIRLDFDLLSLPLPF